MFLKQLSKEKKSILELLWRVNSPVDLESIVRETGLKTRSIIVHLSTLKKMGYISMTDEGLYSLTDKGKEALGLSKIDRDLAIRLLSKVPQEKAFHFYIGVDKPLMVSADSLTDFYEKIQNIDVKSIEFHTLRRDFELWIHFLGDAELAKRLRAFREANLTGEELRRKIYEAVKSRCEELQRIVSSQLEAQS
jgi:predicted transcriptional regulator